MKIVGYDVTRKYDIDEFSPQSGDIISFSLSNNDFDNIVWNINGEIFTNRNPSTIFLLNGTPGQGYVKIKCRVYEYKKIKKITKKILIVPNVDCQIDIEIRPPINNETKTITLQAAVLCSELTLGNTFGGNLNYACGGACLDTCPQYETLMSQIKGTTINKYGQHRLIAYPSIRGSIEGNADCVDIYKNNYLGINSKYPPLIKTFCITPKVEELNIIYNAIKKYLIVDGLSKYMLPKDSIIIWYINRDKYRGGKKLKIELSKGSYKINVKIMIRNCDEVKISKVLTV